MPSLNTIYLTHHSRQTISVVDEVANDLSIKLILTDPLGDIKANNIVICTLNDLEKSEHLKHLLKNEEIYIFLITQTSDLARNSEWLKKGVFELLHEPLHRETIKQQIETLQTLTTHSPIIDQASNVLIVEDEEDNRQNIALLLSNKWNITLAKDGKQARSLINKTSFDIALIDVILPDSTGYTIAEEFKQQNPLGICIIMSALTDRHSLDITWKYADDILPKPFLKNMLLNVIKKAERSVIIQKWVNK